MNSLLIHILFLFMIAPLLTQSGVQNNEIIDQSIQSEKLDPIENLKVSEVISLKLFIPMLGIVVVKNPTIEVQKVTLPLYVEKNIKAVETISYTDPEKK